MGIQGPSTRTLVKIHNSPFQTPHYWPNVHTWLALADVSSFSIPAPSSQADEWILQTLVHIDTRQSGIGQGVPVVALALEGPVHVDAPTVGTHSCLETINQNYWGNGAEWVRASALAHSEWMVRVRIPAGTFKRTLYTGYLSVFTCHRSIWLFL